MITATQNINQAINAYKDAANGTVGDSMGEGPASSGDDFASLVKGAIQEAIQIGERSEQLSIAGINDKADLTQVVTAVAEAEVTLRTVVNVRDKVIDAYREILRMPM
jgi:flagellar hook-basal body complex protein FliE